MPRAIFHLSFPVNELHETLDFYCDVLGGVIGRRQPHWVDVILFRHQLTLQLRPDQVLAREQRGVRHFGFILDWHEWEALADRVQISSPQSVLARELHAPGSFEEHAKLLLEDPSRNLIEIKAYRDLGSICPALAG